MQQNTHSSPSRPLASLLKRAHLLLLIVLGAVALVVPMSAQSFTAANTKTGSILGTVVDTTTIRFPVPHVSSSRAGWRPSHGYNKGRWRLCIRPGPGRSRLSDHRHR